MILTHLSLLGLRVQDKVTGFRGVVTSVSFDLFGCVQATVNPGLDKEGKQRDPYWFDVSRLRVLKNTPVMDPPDFGGSSEVQAQRIADGFKGPAEKPIQHRI